VVTVSGNTVELAGGLQLFRASRKLLVVNNRHSKPQENSQAGPNIPHFDALTFYLSKCIISFILKAWDLLFGNLVIYIIVQLFSISLWLLSGLIWTT
jgi:hypothetical protein